MKAVKVVLIIIGVLAVLIIGLFGYAGGFSKVEVTTAEMPIYFFAYEDYRGDYAETGKVMDKIYEALLEDGIETYKGIGIYYDKPGETEPENLRSRIGCVIEESDIDKAKELADKYNLTYTEPGEAVTSSHPYTTPLSIILGISRVYPAIHGFIKDKDIAPAEVTEIYDVPNKKIYYYMRIAG
jgi:hypothetical protein